MTNKQKVLYSELELRILDNLPKDGGWISTIELAARCYQPNKRPRNARQSILDSANKLIEKSDLNEEEWEIFKSKPKGNAPAYLKKEKRIKNEEK